VQLLGGDQRRQLPLAATAAVVPVLLLEQGDGRERPLSAPFDFMAFIIKKFMTFIKILVFNKKNQLFFNF
jgi:hypothetical protein